MGEAFGGASLSLGEEVKEEAIEGTGCADVADRGAAGADGGREAGVGFAVGDGVGGVCCAGCLVGIGRGWWRYWLLMTDVGSLSAVEEKA